MLSGVTYDDGTQATYTYAQILPSTRPLITSFVDPRYTLPFTKSSTSYFTGFQYALGEIQQQSNYDTGEALYTLSDSYYWHGPTVTTSTGGSRIYLQDSTTSENYQKTDATGQVTTTQYDGNLYPNSWHDARGNVVTDTNSNFNNPTQVNWQDGSTSNIARDSLDLPLSYQDELGRTTTYSRDGNHRVKRNQLSRFQHGKPHL